MKKVYSKPEILFESFAMSTNIAAGCYYTNVTHGRDEYGCGYKLDRYNKVIFTSGMGCTTTEDDGDYNGICYHVPSEESNLFNS